MNVIHRCSNIINLKFILIQRSEKDPEIRWFLLSVLKGGGSELWRVEEKIIPGKRNIIKDSVKKNNNNQECLGGSVG